MKHGRVGNDYSILRGKNLYQDKSIDIIEFFVDQEANLESIDHVITTLAFTTKLTERDSTNSFNIIYKNITYTLPWNSKHQDRITGIQFSDNGQEVFLLSRKKLYIIPVYDLIYKIESNKSKSISTENEASENPSQHILGTYKDVVESMYKITHVKKG